MGGVGISNGINRWGVSGPSNQISPSGITGVTQPSDVPWYESGPLWVLIFLAVGYILVFQTLR